MAKGQVIGYDGKIPWDLPEELALFKRITMGKPLIMGRRTFESIGRPLPGRTNIVLSRQPDLALCGAVVCPSLERALELVANEEEAIVIGGEKVFTQVMPLLKRQYLTQVDIDVWGDAFYPYYDPREWTVSRGSTNWNSDIHWSFAQLEKRET